MKTNETWFLMSILVGYIQISSMQQCLFQPYVLQTHADNDNSELHQIKQVNSC